MRRRAVVTGASAGIGHATALAFARAGLEVVAVARRPDALRSLGEADGIVAVAADVTTPPGVARVRAAVGTQPIDVLVHGAGVFPRGRLDQLGADDWTAAWTTNVSARLQLVLALRPALRAGRVLFIGSDAARTPRAGGAAYSVTKAASEMLWRCLTVEFGDEIAFGMAKPGLVATGMLEASLAAARDRFPAGAVYAAMQQRGETIAPETVARFFLFLALETARDEFMRDIWDIRDVSHHARWLEGPLYLPPAG